jgi:hypothetical protein
MDPILVAVRLSPDKTRVIDITHDVEDPRSLLDQGWWILGTSTIINHLAHTLAPFELAQLYRSITGAHAEDLSNDKISRALWKFLSPHGQGIFPSMQPPAVKNPTVKKSAPRPTVSRKGATFTSKR